MNTNTKQQRFINRQGGWTFWSLLFTLAVIGFFAYIAMRLIPLYQTNANVVNAMNLSLDNENLNSLKRATVTRKITAQLYLDGTEEFLDYKTDLIVKRDQRNVIVETHYERKVPLFYNISIALDFDNVVERPL